MIVLVSVILYGLQISIRYRVTAADTNFKYIDIINDWHMDIIQIRAPKVDRKNQINFYDFDIIQTKYFIWFNCFNCRSAISFQNTIAIINLVTPEYVKFPKQPQCKQWFLILILVYMQAVISMNHHLKVTYQNTD